jgi:N-acetylmuramoyl-L-alanine amidase
MTTYRYAFGRVPLFPSSITICLLLFCLVGLPIGNARGEIDVWIDPGHGGSQSGTEGFDGPDFPNEKDITLPVANRVESRLFELGFFCVHKTRNSDRKVTVQDRAAIANGDLANDEIPPFRDTARLFVSIHMNDWVPSRFGTETYYSAIKPAGYDKKAKQADINAATKIQTDLMTKADVAFGPTCSDDRGVMQNNYYVLAFTALPAVLVEVCYLTNACQYNRIIQLSWQNYRTARGMPCPPCALLVWPSLDSAMTKYFRRFVSSRFLVTLGTRFIFEMAGSTRSHTLEMPGSCPWPKRR